MVISFHTFSFPVQSCASVTEAESQICCVHSKELSSASGNNTKGLCIIYVFKCLILLMFSSCILFSEAYVKEGDLGSVVLPQTKEIQSFHVSKEEGFPPIWLETTEKQNVLTVGSNPPQSSNLKCMNPKNRSHSQFWLVYSNAF